MGISIQLPFDLGALPMQTNQYQAYSTGILMSAKDPNVFDWLASYSLRIRSVNEEFSCYHPGDCPQLFQDLKFAKNDCLIRHSSDMPNEYFLEHAVEMLNIIQAMLMLGFYVHGDFNEYYEQHCSYGENALKRLPQIIRRAGETNPFFVAKNVRGYFEHVYFLLFILEKIEHLNYFRVWCLEKSKYVALAAKYFICKNNDILDKIIPLIEEAIMKECETIKCLLQLDIWSSGAFFNS